MKLKDLMLQLVSLMAFSGCGGGSRDEDAVIRPDPGKDPVGFARMLIKDFKDPAYARESAAEQRKEKFQFIYIVSVGFGQPVPLSATPGFTQQEAMDGKSIPGDLQVVKIARGSYLYAEFLDLGKLPAAMQQEYLDASYVFMGNYNRHAVELHKRGAK